jgi:hypothetical protein
MLVRCAGGCKQWVREDNAVCSKRPCLEKVLLAPPKPEINTTHKAFAHHKAALIASVSVPKGS